MMLKFLSVLLYCLRWLAWAFHYLIVWPAATLMLLVIMLFWLDNSTPGQVAADEIAASTRYVSHGEFRIPGHCGPNLGGLFTESVVVPRMLQVMPLSYKTVLMSYGVET